MLHVKKEFDKSDKKHRKVRDHCHYTGKYRGAAYNISNLRYKIPKEIPIVFHNGSKRENTEKYITFSVPIKKSLKIKTWKLLIK